MQFYGNFCDVAPRHCEERSDEAIQQPAPPGWIASLRSQ
jgi:hypothetical protein